MVFPVLQESNYLSPQIRQVGTQAQLFGDVFGAGVFVSLSVVAPCVALAFLGAGLRLLVVRIAAAGSSD